MQRRHFHRFISITIFLFAIQIITSGIALAHRGHAGPTKVFMEEGEDMKTMLPEGGKILKRKEALKKEKYREAVKRWGYSPAEGVHTYYISKEKDGKLLGALFIRSVEYKHGEIALAVSYGRDGHLSGIKILSCPEKYVKNLAEDVATGGFLGKFEHLKTDDVVAAGKAYEKESEGSLRRILAKEIGVTAILLETFHGL